MERKKTRTVVHVTRKENEATGDKGGDKRGQGESRRAEEGVWGSTKTKPV